ncbi:hypothetical protein [Salegentibacter sp. Hel_I_6]|uniref:hypothetical protein n=1 Tax=Salegentibacter sp. Hel_I_6 TaxID=1250278 RepID=UPI00055A841B|nr:hypothetical protein [Salegentibacter sp. Hel_I_6]
MSKSYARQFWFDTHRILRDIRELYKTEKNNAYLEEYLHYFNDLKPINQSQEFQALFDAYNKKNPYKEALPLINDLSSFLIKEGLAADEKCKKMWEHELLHIEPLKNFFKSKNPSIKILKEKLAAYEKKSVFKEEREYLNFKSIIYKEKNIETLEWWFNHHYAAIVLGANVFKKKFPEFWKKELRMYQNLWNSLLRINHKYNTLLDSINYCNKYSFYRDRMNFFKLRYGIIKHIPSNNINDRCEELEEIYHLLFQEINIEFKKTGIKYSSVIPTSFVESDNEEKHIMNSFRNGNQDNYGY